MLLKLFGTDIKVARRVVAYHALIFLLFTAVYWSIGFEHEFVHPPGITKPGLRDCVYFAATVHSTSGFGDVYPKTTRARAAVGFHMLAAMVGTLGFVSIY